MKYTTKHRTNLIKKRSLISLFFLSNKQTFYTLKENDKSCIYEKPYAMKNPSIPEFDGWMMLRWKTLKHKNYIETSCIHFYFYFSDTHLIIYIIFLYCIKAWNRVRNISLLINRNSIPMEWFFLIFKIYMMGIKILEYTVFSMGGY